MEGMALYLVAALLIGFPWSSHGGLYTLITPGVLRTDTNEQILVEAHGDNAPKQLDILIHDFPRKQKTLFQKRVDMNPAGGMLVTPTIKIHAKELNKDSRKNQYVVVQVIGLPVRLEKVVLLSYQSGFVFIQTDKGIYTSGSPVRYRVFSMDHNMHRMDKTVIVEFQTPQGIVVSSNPINPSSSLIQPYNLSEHASFGTWKAVAKYEHSPEESYTAYFDVREYVLPSFEVRLQPSEKFLYIDGNKNFQVSISARYFYGKKVEGVAFVLFGVIIDDVKKSIPESLTRIPIIEGDGDATLERHTLRSRFPNLNELVGNTLYVSVTVITESGSDMVVTELSSIHIVTSPYQIFFTKTPKYFKPGMPYELMVYVINPDGSPAANVPVIGTSDAIHSEGITLSDGTAKLILNTPLNLQSLPITVRTNHGDLPGERQGTRSMTATAYQTQGGSGNYLHIIITSTDIKPGDNLPIFFFVKGNANSLNQIQYFTYLILTKGKIFKVGRQPRRAGQNLVTMNLRITPDLIPSFRFVAYYQVGNNEIVADSVWVDVKDTCMGKLVVKGASSRDNRIQKPGAPMKIKLEGDPGARISLVAVDKAVYLLNDKYKISQVKIWETIEKSDFGCTVGSGQNNLGVFEDAGLALITSTNLNTKPRSDAKCPKPANRRRRSSVLLFDSKESKDEFFEDSNIISRSDFPESWLWLTENLPEQPNNQGISSKTLSFYLRDSITNWVVLAVGISPTKGICVAEPYEITVMKEFFIDLEVPYSVVKNEQVEIRAVLHNYAEEDIYVRVELLYNPAFCSDSTERSRYRTQFMINALSSMAVPFVIVPLQQGLHDIEVRASVRGELASDGVRKKLKVVTKLNEDFTVSASGDGNATITILPFYNVQLLEEANICNKFHLEVYVENVHLNLKQANGAKAALMLKICTRYLGEVDSTMAIIDVSMLTGFLPDVEDLTKLSKGADRYIYKFEIDNNMAQKGSVIIYLDKVSHSEDECLQFKIHKHFEVGFIQPRTVKVYSYYNLDEQCSKFYQPDKGTGLLNKICRGNICRCAEETCSLLNQQKEIDLQSRIQKACKPNVDYVYKTKLLRIEENDANVTYVMEVLEVIKGGTDRNPQAKPRQYASQRKCQEALNLKLDNDYLIWGLSSDLWPMKDDISYLITKNTWIERWPNENECLNEEFQNLCEDLVQLSNALIIFGCPT
ncbi:A.superbus venom factor 1-like isoform X2 [Erythrolamprus reginae]|uniref:A.superbus venom factor 1-like isoform X2 n=1 Tax=Erythrolamprus reginae TaxID=121349 RepID=UPI00396C424C